MKKNKYIDRKKEREIKKRNKNIVISGPFRLFCYKYRPRAIQGYT